jgi:alpha-tubulin suppressor-like RCC1 family protein
MQDSVVGSLTANCTFTTTNSGTYVLTSTSSPGSTQTGTFVLYSGNSPVSMAGLNIIVTVTSGGPPFATNGYYQFLPTITGDAYTLIGRSNVNDSAGTFSYTQNSPMTGVIAFTDSATGSGYSSQLSFDTENTGTAFLRSIGNAGYQTGTFKIVAPGAVVSWGDQGLIHVPFEAQSGVTAVAMGEEHAVALKNDGSVVAWGLDIYSNAPVVVPEVGKSGGVAIAAGYYHTAVLKTNGGVYVWGYNGLGVTNVPTLAQSGVSAIAAGSYHMLALKTNGSVVAWGSNQYGESTVPLAAQNGVKAIAAGNGHSLALKNDGSVIAWGEGTNNTGVAPNCGQSQVPFAAQTGVIAIAAARWNSAALKADGTVVVWGECCCSLTNVPAPSPDAFQVAVDSGTGLVLTTNGMVSEWGYIPAPLPVGARKMVTSIAARYVGKLALVGTGILSSPGLRQQFDGQHIVFSWPTTPTGFKLQTSPFSASALNWTDCTNVPVIFAGQFTVTNSATDQARCFRLKQTVSNGQ